MSKLSVQLVIGRLLIDDEFRRRLEQRQRECLARMCEQGLDLNDTEIAALVETDVRLWSRMAARIDRRLRIDGVSADGADRPAHKPLTSREQHVLRGVFDGLPSKQIAAEIGVSEGAVKATLQHLFRKMHVRTRAQLVRVAMECSLALGLALLLLGNTPTVAPGAGRQPAPGSQTAFGALIRAGTESGAACPKR